MENYKYLLQDNNGAVYLDFEIKLSISSKFEYLSYNYEVIDITHNNLIICDRL